MATKNIVPRATGEGGIGTSVKRWLGGFFNSLDVANGTNAPVNTLQRSTAYALNDVAFYSGIDARYFLKCTTAGTTGSTVPSFTGATSCSTVTDGTVVWTVKTLGSEEQFDDFLPLTGGTVTGNLSVSGTITGDLTGDVTGNADTATNATNDGLGNNIANTYQTAVVGAVIAFAGSTSPAGWLLCDGSAVSRTDYAALFAVIGTTYGAGDGTSTFNLPNMGGRVPIGVGTGTDSRETNTYNVGATGGEYSHQLSVEEIPSHEHMVTWLRDYPLSLNHGSITGYNISWQESVADTDGFVANAVGGNGLHNNVQPYLALNYIIKY